MELGWFYSGSVLIDGRSMEITETSVGLGLRYIYGSLFHIELFGQLTDGLV
jgi:hypothetical protein